jgi:hypothetical protein
VVCTTDSRYFYEPETATGEILYLPHQGATRGEADVDRLNQYDIYQAAASIHRVSNDYGSPDSPLDAYFVLTEAMSGLDQLLALKPLRIALSRGSAVSLRKRIQEVFDRHYRNPDGAQKIPEGGKSPVTTYDWYMLKDSLKDFESVFRAEMQSASVYAVPDKPGYSIPTLIDDGHFLLPEPLQHIIGEKAITDYRSATRCFAFSLPTAAGYHAARAMESVVETYFQTFMNKPGATKTGWKDYVIELRKLHTRKPKPKHLPDNRTLYAIDEVREHHRNPLMHPREVLSDTDADMILTVAKAAMVKMAEEIKAVWEAKKHMPGRIRGKKPGTQSRSTSAGP